MDTEGDGTMKRVATRMDLLAELPKQMVMAELGVFEGAFSRVRLHQGFTTEVLGTFPDDYFDFVYVDASHKYQNVKADLLLSYSEVRDGGYICGHDCQYVVDGKDTHFYEGLRHSAVPPGLAVPGRSLGLAEVTERA